MNVYTTSTTHVNSLSPDKFSRTKTILCSCLVMRWEERRDGITEMVRCRLRWEVIRAHHYNKGDLIFIYAYNAIMFLMLLFMICSEQLLRAHFDSRVIHPWHKTQVVQGTKASESFTCNCWMEQIVVAESICHAFHGGYLNNNNRCSRL